MSIFFTLVYFVGLIIYCYNRKFWLPSIYIVTVYFVSLLASLLIYFTSKNAAKSISFFPSVLFCVLLTISFIPFFQKSPKIIVDRSYTFRRKIILVGYVLSFLLITASAMLFTKIQEAYYYGLVDVRQDMYKGVSFLSKYNTIEHIGHSVLRWFGDLSYILILLFFYSLAYIPKHKILKIMMLLASLSVAYFGMLNGGRTKFTYWILFFLFALSLFYKEIPEKERKWSIMVVFIPTFLLLIFYIVVITIGRADASNIETDTMTFSYMGQSYINFCEFVENLKYHPYSLHRIFPFTSSLLGHSMDLGTYRYLIHSKAGVDIGIFYTFMGDIFVDVGLLGLIIYVVLVFGIVGNRLCHRNKITIYDIIVIGIFARIVLHGLFYYSMYQRETTVSLILTILLAYYLKPKLKNKMR